MSDKCKEFTQAISIYGLHLLVVLMTLSNKDGRNPWTAGTRPEAEEVKVETLPVTVHLQPKSH